MIAKSDLVILAISATLLVAGIYRWQSNLSRFNGTGTVAEAGRNVQARASSTSSLNARPASNSTTTPAATVRESAPAVNFGDTAQPATGTDTARNASSASSGSTTPPIQTDNEPDAGTETGTSPSIDASLYGNYIVQPGDTLSRISILYGTTVETLREINDINGSLINVGQNIRYPLPAN